MSASMFSILRGPKAPLCWTLIFTIGTFLLAASWWLPALRYQICTDGVSYIRTAQLYVHGDWTGAINGYWSPLYSWLLVPFLLAGVDPLFAPKLLVVILGPVLLVLITLLSGRFAESIWVRSCAVVLSLPLVIEWTLGGEITPDLVLLILLVAYFLVLTSPKYSQTAWRPVACGALGGLAYLTKSYALPFFVVHFTLFHLAEFWRNRHAGAWLSRYATGVTVFALLIAPWVIAISQKYDQFTLGTSARYNAALAAPKSTGQPFYVKGLLPPGEPEEYSAWDDASYLPLPADGKMSSLIFSDPLFLARKFKANARSLHSLFTRASPLFISIGFAAILFTLAKAGADSRPLIIFTAITIAIYLGGYLPLFIIDRYNWFAYLLTFMLGVTLFDHAVRREVLFRWAHWAVPLVMFLSFLPGANFRLREATATGMVYHDVASDLDPAGELQGANLATAGHWDDSFFISYHLGARYFGALLEDSDLSQRQLRQYEVTHLMRWADSSIEVPAQFERIAADRSGRVELYRRRLR